MIDNKHSSNFFFMAVVLLFLLTRLVHLTIIPIFNDEAIYISWAKIINEDLHDIWLPIKVDNSKPLFLWLIAIFLNLFENPLWAARFVSVLAGFFSLIGVYLIGQKLHSKWVGCLSALFYTVCPYYLFYDRMAHKDSLLNCLFTWLLFLTLEMLKMNENDRGRYYLAMGFTIGLSLLTKGTAILFVMLPLILIFIFSRKNTLVLWKPLIFTYLPGFLIGIFPYGFLFLTSSDFSVKNIFIPTGNSLGQASITDILYRIPTNLYHGAGGTISYFTTYLTIPVTLLAAAFFIFQFKFIKNKTNVVLICYFLIPYFSLLSVVGQGFSRHYLFCGTPILLCAAMALYYGVDHIKKRIPGKSLYLTIAPIAIIALYPAIIFDIKLLTEPENVSFVERDYDQYISDEFSGYGIPEALNYFKKVSTNKKIAVFTTPNWGNPADSVYIYLSDSPNLSVYTTHWVFEQNLLPARASKIIIKNMYQKYTGKNISELLINSDSYVYFICSSSEFEQHIFLKKNKNFQLVRSFRKPSSTISIDIYKRTS